MKRIDRLILKELWSPWLSGVAMFSTLLMAATYLNRITDYVVQGVPASMIGEITMLLLPAILVKTFAMATLLGALLAFGRLSSDSEIVALRAAGASIYRIIRPVGLFAVVIASLAFAFNETFVPYAAKRSQALAKIVARSLNAKANQPASQSIVDEGKLVGFIVAQDFNLRTSTLRNVTIVARDEAGKDNFYLEAKELQYKPPEGGNPPDWRIVGGAKLVGADGRSRLEIEDEVWPSTVPKVNLKPEEIGTQQINDPDYFSARELWRQLQLAKIDKTLTPEQYRNREYWFWNKFALPFAAFVFGLLGAALGIRNHRTGNAAGFAIAIGITFAYMTLANFMNTWAMGGIIPSWLASFTPIVLGTIAAVVIMWRRNIG